MTTGEIVVQVLSVDAFLSMLGWLFAAAMIVGGVLDDDYKNLLRWAFAGITYVVFQELARRALISDMTKSNHDIALIVSIITLIVYTAGLALGWSIAAIAKIRVRRQFVYVDKNELPDLQEKDAQG